MSVMESLVTVTRREGLDPLTERLLDIRRWLGDDLIALEQGIASVVSSDETDDLARRAAEHLLGRAGKRIRPLCVLLAARLGGRKLDDQVKNLAVACELVHAATLLHDDVIDEGTERRGVPSARMVYGNSASILAGDHLLLKSLKLAESVGYRRLVGDLLDTISEMVAAEAVQLERRGNFEPDRDSYLRVIRGKTAGLFRWGLLAGGTLAGLSEEQCNGLARVGSALGLAFQLVDDVLDLAGDPEVTGKDLLVDLREGKLTWPIIVAAEKDPWVLAMAKSYVSDGARAAEAGPLIERLRTSGAIEATREFAEQQGAIAISELEKLPESSSRNAIALVVEACIHRSK